MNTKLLIATLLCICAPLFAAELILSDGRIYKAAIILGTGDADSVRVRYADGLVKVKRELLPEGWKTLCAAGALEKIESGDRVEANLTAARQKYAEAKRNHDDFLYAFQNIRVTRSIVEGDITWFATIRNVDIGKASINLWRADKPNGRNIGVIVHDTELVELGRVLNKFFEWDAQCDQLEIKEVVKPLPCALQQYRFEFERLHGRSYLISAEGLLNKRDIEQFAALMLQLPSMLGEMRTKIETIRKSSALK